MVAAASINAPQGDTLAVQQSASTIEASGGGVQAVYNIPTPYIRSTAASIDVVYRWTAQEIQTTQSYTLAVVRGTISNPALRSWYYTLDGHDFYVLKLGTKFKTLVYDLETGKWSYFNTAGQSAWRASIGMNWRSSGSIGGVYGSNVVVGDDSTGILWVLDPTYGLDDNLEDDQPAGTFERIATGQMVQRGRQHSPVYSVDLTASTGSPAQSDMTISLSYSDDNGNSYVVADDVKTAITGDYNQDITWYSLGLIKYPGRLFRLTDDGAVARIDSLDVNLE